MPFVSLWTLRTRNVRLLANRIKAPRRRPAPRLAIIGDFDSGAIVRLELVPMPFEIVVAPIAFTRAPAPQDGADFKRAAVPHKCARHRGLAAAGLGDEALACGQNRAAHESARAHRKSWRSREGAGRIVQ